jgi:hypothetical protein
LAIEARIAGGDCVNICGAAQKISDTKMELPTIQTNMIAREGLTTVLQHWIDQLK